MRIIYTHDIFSTQHYGGISRYFFEIATYISQGKDEKVEVFAPIYVTKYFHNRKGLSIRGIRIPYVAKIVQFSYLANRMVSQLLVKPRKNVDILHETYYTRTDCSPHKAKKVITCFDMVHEKFSEIISPKDKTAMIKAEAIKRADHIICISENTRKDLIEILGVPEDKTSVTYLACSFRANDNFIVSPQIGRPFILYVGPRFSYKNFERFLRAFAMSNFLKKDFSIVCFGGGSFNEQERVLANSLNIPEEQLIQMSGADEKLAGLYASAAAFVYPSLYEGFGIPPLEAMTFGCPVVCSNTSSIPEVVGDAAELFDPRDEEMMCAAMERVVTDTARSKKLIGAGYDRVKQFSWTKCAQETLNIYHSLL